MVVSLCTLNTSSVCDVASNVRANDSVWVEVAAKGGEQVTWEHIWTETAVSVRATAERLSRDLAGDPKHIYKHKYNRKRT